YGWWPGLADVPPRAQRVLWDEHLQAIDRHDTAGPEDVRGEPAYGGEVRREEPLHRLLPPGSTARRPGRRGVRHRGDRPICGPLARATRQGYLADGRRRPHRLLS